MKLIATLAVLAALTTSLSAGEYKKWYKVIESEDGSVAAISTCGAYKKGALGPNEYPEGYNFPPTIEGETGPDAYKYWKKSGNDWVEMTQAEKDAEDSVLKTENADYELYDDDLKATIEVLMDELGITKQQMKDKLKTKVKAKKSKKAEKEQ